MRHPNDLEKDPTPEQRPTVNCMLLLCIVVIQNPGRIYDSYHSASILRSDILASRGGLPY